MLAKRKDKEQCEDHGVGEGLTEQPAESLLEVHGSSGDHRRQVNVSGAHSQGWGYSIDNDREC